MDSLTPFPRFSQRGFTLTEMAVVLIIVALLIGGMMLPLSAQQDIRRATETQRQLGEIAEALYGFAATHAALDGKPYLPCPDTDNDGLENRGGTACTAPEGTLPWATLGIGREDAWGNAFRYRVAGTFSDGATGFTFLTPGDLRVCTSAACTQTLGSTLPAVFLSLGKNGAAGSQPDELANLDGNTDFVRHDGDSSGFDDLVAWLPMTLLVNRMISAGRLP